MTDLPDDGRVADATDENWVDKYAPRASRPFLRLSRADRPAGTWLLLIPCWWGIALAVAARGTGWTMREVSIALLCAAGAFLMRGAGCTWNDITDREIDAQVARTKSRPLPSGQVTVSQAMMWLVLQTLLAFCILLSFNSFTIWLGMLALLPVVIYPFAKRFTWWPQVFLGIAFNWGCLLGWAAVTGGLAAAPVLLYLSGIAWTLFYDTIYAHQDKDDDALIGVRSTARLFGDQTPRFLLAFQIACVLLMTVAIILALAPLQDRVQLLAALIAPWAFGAHMTWQMRQLDIDDADICLRLFRSNRNAGLLPVLFFAIIPLVLA
jgi:4-hydroxybenzoate polyprenyltransferase